MLHSILKIWVTEATFDDGESRPILIGGTINIELLIPQSIYDNGTFVGFTIKKSNLIWNLFYFMN